MRKFKGKIPLLAFGLITFASIFVAAGIMANAQASSEEPAHMISIFDNGKTINVKSEASTVQDALVRAKVELGAGDKVEPALDEPINANDYNINVYRARNLVVLDGNRKFYVKTASVSPADIAADAGVELLDADIVRLVTYNNILESGTNVAYKVIRAKTVKLDFYGKQLSIRTQAKTIADFLKERNISSDKKVNWISRPLDEVIVDSVAFSIQPQGRKTITIDEEIQYREVTTYDYELAYGKREITKRGQNGKKTVTYEVEMRDGVELSRKLVSEIIVKAAVAQEVKVGMKVDLPAGSHEEWMAAAGIPASQYGYVNYIITRESHWNPLARNRSSGATGLCQALPGNKMASAGSDWATNPITQLRWCNGYAVGRYGSWEKAYQFWTTHYWW